MTSGSESEEVVSQEDAGSSGDSLFEVDANINGSKTNYFLTPYTMSGQNTLDATGDATHHLTLTYTWPPNPRSLIKDYAAGINDWYRALSRLYVPLNPTLVRQAGWADPGSATAFGRNEWSGITYGAYGDSLKVSFTWTVPHAATHDGSGWHYHLLMQKQAGIMWLVYVQVTLPSCAFLTGKPIGFSTTSVNSTSVNEPLLNDVQFPVDYRLC